jgi:cyclopropane fatty-acyl-phospholipid synthase-like methyltransferase
VPDFTPFHQDLTWMTPLSEARAESLVAFLAESEPATVYDVGCGWAELLLRVLAASPSSRGRGADLDVVAIERGRSEAERRGLASRVELVAADARELAGPADGVLCVGSSQIWGPPVEDAQPLDYAAALAALSALVPQGGRVVYGEGVWSRPPTPAAVAPLAGRDDEFVALPELLELVAAAGFLPVQVHEATVDEWDVFESGYAARFAHWLAEHGPEHPEADEVRARAARQRAAYFDGYRGVLGMAYLCLVAV